MSAKAHASPDRDRWGSATEFVLCCLGYAVGLGNVWRFPYLCGKNGGAAFMIPYLIMMVFAGLPVFYMELAIGQYAQVSPVILYSRMSPIFSGLGMCMILAQAYTAIYYNMIIAWSLHYLGNSFRSPLTWSHCNNTFNTWRCYDDILFEKCLDGNKTYYFGGCLTNEELLERKMAIDVNWNTAVEEKFKKNETKMEIFRDNFTIDVETYGWNEEQVVKRKLEQAYNFTGRDSPTYEYLYKRMLKRSKGIEPEYYGTPNWELVLCLLGAWVLVFLCLLGGTKTSGKVVYFTATFPYVILIILLGRGLTLGPGVTDGLKFFVVPNVTAIGNSKIWSTAAMQIFFSLSLGGGGLTTIASYNKFHNNLFRDTLIVVLGNCGTSFFAGLVIFPVVGFIANELGQKVADVASDGIGLAFQVYPHAINRMAVPQLWAFLFFFMLVLLGIDSQLVMTETPVTAILDTFPSLRSTPKKVATVAGFCTLGFVVGLVFTTPGGPYFLTIMDTYAGGWPLVIACIFELIMVMWVYGFQNFIKDVKLMLGKPPNKFYKYAGYPVNPYWIANWVVITPILLIVVLLYDLSQTSRSTSGSYTFPVWADVLGWFITLSCIIWIPIFAVYKIIRYRNKGRPWSALFKPTAKWGPGEEGVHAPHLNGMQKSDVVAPAGNIPGRDNMAYEGTKTDGYPMSEVQGGFRPPSYNGAMMGGDFRY